MDHFNTNSNRATSNAPRFYQRSQSVVDRNGFTTDPLPSISHPPMQNEWPGPPVPVRSERRAAFRRRVRFSSFRLAATWFMIYLDRFISFFCVMCDPYLFTTIVLRTWVVQPRVLAQPDKENEPKKGRFSWDHLVVVTHHNRKRDACRDDEITHYLAVAGIRERIRFRFEMSPTPLVSFLQMASLEKTRRPNNRTESSYLLFKLVALISLSIISPPLVFLDVSKQIRYLDQIYTWALVL